MMAAAAAPVLALLFTVFAAPFAVAAVAAPDEADETVDRVAHSAEQRLEKSVGELAALRDLIAGEKLPMARELTALEEKLTSLRHEVDQATRLVDSGNLELVGLRSAQKAHEDELAYVSTLLDEYARTFESKINVSELQYCGEPMARAKQVAELADLTTEDKFGRQLEFVGVTTKRLFEAIGGMVFPGVGVDLQGSVVDGKFAIVGPVALFCAATGAAGLVVPQSGSSNPLIRPLEGPMQAGLAALVTSGEGNLPLDPSRGGALKALVQKTNLMHIFEKGGPIMWPLALASILAFGTVLERLLFLLIERFRRDGGVLDRMFDALAKGDTEAAITAGKGSKFYVVRALTYALNHREHALENALMYAQARELKRFRRGVPILDTVITLAPLLGLLGTVVGMMGSFALIGGELSAPGAITGGIAEALIATAFGLGIAITSLLPFNFLNARAADARHELESASTQLELLVRGRTPAVALAVGR